MHMGKDGFCSSFECKLAYPDVQVIWCQTVTAIFIYRNDSPGSSKPGVTWRITLIWYCVVVIGRNMKMVPHKS